MKRRTLPVAVFGSSRSNTIQRGYLNGASRVLTTRAGRYLVEHLSRALETFGQQLDLTFPE